MDGDQGDDVDNVAGMSFTDPDHVMARFDALRAKLGMPVDRVDDGDPDIPDYASDLLPIERYIATAECPMPEPEPAQAHTTWPAPIDLACLAGREPEQPSFIVPGWLPAGYATLFAGHGGVGKSAIALQLAVCIALGLEFAGLQCEQRRVLYLSCEDREGVLHWRLARICARMGIQMADLAGKLDILDLVGHDAMLWAPDPRTGDTYTAAFGHLADRMQASGAEVLMVDGISDTFGGNENARTDAKRYVNALLSIVPADTGALVLIGHVAKPAASESRTSEGYSGSTGWHNSVRARWYLYPEIEGGDEGGRTGRLSMDLQKSNLGPSGEAVTWVWDDGAHMFVPEAAPSRFDRASQERNEQRGILRALKACADAGISVPAATTGRRTAFHVLSVQPNFADSMRSGGAATRRFWREMERLRSMGMVADSVIRRDDRHKTAVIVLTSFGMRECG